MDMKIGVDRREFLKIAGAGVTAATVLAPRDAGAAQEAAQKAALDRIASNSYPIRSCFKSRPNVNAAPARTDGGPNPADAAFAANPNAKRPLAVAEAAAAARASNLTAAQMKAKYGEITMLDFPAFTKEHFPGVTRMDIFSGLFGDVTDDTMFFRSADGSPGGFDPLSPSGRKWLERLANALVKTGTKVQHISNNAPTDLAAHGSAD